MKHSYQKLLVLLIMCVVGSHVMADNRVVNGIYYDLNESTQTAKVIRSSSGNKYSGMITIPSSIVSNGVEYVVTEIGIEAFYGCSGLTSITIPNSVTSIGEEAFSGCSALTSITIPNSVTSIGNGTFWDCSLLFSVNLPGNLQVIDENAFYGCASLSSINFPKSLQFIGHKAFCDCTALTYIAIPEKVKLESAFVGCTGLTEVYFSDFAKIDPYAFGGCVNLKTVTFSDNIKVVPVEADSFLHGVHLQVNKGSKTLLTLWQAGYDNIYEKETKEPLPPTKLKFVSSTQTTATFNVENIYPEYTNTYDDKPLKSSQIVLSGLKPNARNTLTLNVALDNLSYERTANYATKDLGAEIQSATSATTLNIVGNYTQDDAKVKAQSISIDGNVVNGNSAQVVGLDPQSTHSVVYTTTVSYGENDEFEEDYTTTAEITTGELVFNTLAPKVITPGEVIVAAESNITNDEEKVGFEWRRTDAPEEVKSRSGEAFLFEGTMEGYIHNLTSFNYWRFRPYYESASGKRFYGNWGIVEADDYSYFEPTVHTYAKIEVGDNSAVVKGYATRGSDDVTEQGFKYWEASAGARAENRQLRSPNVPTDAKSVAATGQVMTAELTGLTTKQTYHYVAYMKTSKGATYYGEQQTFTAGENTTGIEELRLGQTETGEVTIMGRYDIQGRKIDQPVKGLNILLMSDGSTKKVYIKK